MIHCHHVDGTCVTGCEQGFLGDRCQTGTPKMWMKVFKQWHLLKAVVVALFQFCFICITLSFFKIKKMTL